MLAPAVPSPSVEALHAVFLDQLLPRLRRHGRIYFRDVQDPDRKEELPCEMAALGWHWLVRLAERGKDATQFLFALASYAARAVRAGRRLPATSGSPTCSARRPAKATASRPCLFSDKIVPPFLARMQGCTKGAAHVACRCGSIRS